jgi:hypothetical protein
LPLAYKDLCDEILQLGGVLSAAVITMEGNILFSNHKSGIESILSVRESEAAVFKAAIRMGTRKEFLDKLGGINYAFAEYGKINQYTIPLDKEVSILLLVAEQKQNNGAGSPGFGNIMQILKKFGLR